MELEQLDVQKLGLIKMQLEEEIERLTTSFAQLRHAGTKYRASRLSVDSIQEREIMVPLTSSLYVPGRIADPNHVLVELGTGYFVERPIQAAREFCDRKLKMLKDNMDSAANLINQRRRELEMVIQTIQKKQAS
jgi:prefoldin alpha subunit